MRPEGSAEALERRRRVAVRRVKEGWDPGVVAAVNGVSRRSLRRWVRREREHGPGGLAARPARGRPPKLDEARRERVLGWLRQSPADFGYRTELWTAARVAKLIADRLGVHYHPRYVNEWLKRHGITPQKPETQARERDEAEIERWKQEEWPRILKTRGR